MARKRYISTELSTDGKLADLSVHGFLPLLLYTWSIPHMDDWGRLTGDARQFKLLVCPALDILLREVDEALNQIAAAGLWERYEVDGKWCISVPATKWFKHQSYINKGKREDDSGSDFPSPDQHRKTPQNTEERRETPNFTEERRGSPQIAVIQQETPQNTASFSFSSSLSVSPYKTSTTTTGSPNPFKLFESEGFGTISSTIADKLGEMIDFYGERWVIEAMKEASISGKRSLKYVEGILKRFKSEGVDEPWQQKSEQSKAPEPIQRSQQWRPRGNGAPSRQKLAAMPSNVPGPQLSQEEMDEIRRMALKLDGKAEVS